MGHLHYIFEQQLIDSEISLEQVFG